MKNYYSGQGQKSVAGEVPKYEASKKLTDPEGYQATPELAEAVNVALMLGQPLLLTGEPGTGKTALAESVAWELGLDEVLKFHVKSTSDAKDLLYTYDALGYFQQVQISKAKGETKEVKIKDFLTYEALGEAIKQAAEGSNRRVVLIDEIDKAPRDLPNDLLLELDKMSFKVPELSNVDEEKDEFTADPSLRPIVIITSNTEKNLPAAFLRRCVYFHIDFPDRDKLIEIVDWRLFRNENDKTEGRKSSIPPELEQTVNRAVDFFLMVRNKEVDLRKKPATAEMLSWLRIVLDIYPDKDNHHEFDDSEKKDLIRTFAVLVKQNSDRIKLLQHLGWHTV